MYQNDLKYIKKLIYNKKKLTRISKDIFNDNKVDKN